MDTLDTAEMRQRFQKRAEAIRNRNIPPVAGLERKAFVKQAELDFQDFAMIADSTISLDGGILTVDLRMEICDAAIRGTAPVERETQVAMQNIADALPTDGAKITPSMLDSKADLQDMIDGAKMFEVVETIEPIDVKTCPGFSLAHGYLV